MMKIYTKTLLMIIFMIGSIPLFSAQYLVVLSFDGNSYDADDLIAASLALAILEESGNKNKLVHCDYGNNPYRETEYKNVYGDASPRR